FALLPLTCMLAVLNAPPLFAQMALHVVPPTGFVDVLAPDAVERCVPPDEPSRARAVGFVAYAMDVRCPNDVRAKFAVREDPLDGPITEGYVERTLSAARRPTGTNHATLDVREKSLVTIAGVHGARLVFDLTAEGEQHRILMYLVPDGPRVAL